MGGKNNWQKSRQDNLLRVIIEEYIKSANPVGSNLIVDKYLKDVSSATVRNDMAELEESGLIFQPHTSAGRVPTLAGYEYYLNNFAKAKEIDGRSKKILDDLEIKPIRDNIKILAKTLAEISGEAVLVGFSPMDVFYTGIANLFRQPEFAEEGLVYSMSEIIDHLDEVMAKIFNEIKADIKIFIGQNNPFGNLSAAVIAKYRFGKNEGIIGILGPSRMDYRENMALIKYSKMIINRK